jgi:hypothetical protein
MEAEASNQGAEVAHNHALKITKPIACEKNTALRTPTARALMPIKKSVLPQHSAAASPIITSTRYSRPIVAPKVSKKSLVEHR